MLPSSSRSSLSCLARSYFFNPSVSEKESLGIFVRQKYCSCLFGMKLLKANMYVRMSFLRYMLYCVTVCITASQDEPRGWRTLWKDSGDSGKLLFSRLQFTVAKDYRFKLAKERKAYQAGVGFQLCSFSRTRELSQLR